MNENDVQNRFAAPSIPSRLRVFIAGFTPFFVAAVLLLAAGLKSFDLFSGAVEGNLYWPIVEVLCEFILGGALISSLYFFQSLWLALVMFAVFLLVSIHKIWIGSESCGCFGPVQVNPRFSLALDVFIILLLLITLRHTRSKIVFRFWRLVTAGIIMLFLAVGGVWGAIYLQPAQLQSDGRLIGGHGVVYFQPFDWQGQKLPLLPFISGGDVLESGHWLLVIYYHECPICQQAVATVSAHLKSDPNHRVALLQIPPFGALPSGIASPGMLELKLDGQRRWRPPLLPILLDLDGGKITAARAYVPGAWWGF
ncbi:MAG TPA: hypothetical protein VKJ65_12115 [Phycisphaerae bacterium]|nr:hypothetical protein [Phycisphaerae bacterium]